MRSILGNRHSNLWPEPLDLLEIENTRDPFAFSIEGTRTAEPVVVYARPSGRFLPEWQQQIVPISSIFSVLAELLEFMRQAHAENLLLLGLGPLSLIIDASDRVHYVGAEMVLSRQSGLLKETTPAGLWQRLYPVDRFARGYSAPECFDPGQRPDVRADLYAWGALAFTLFTGADLSRLAQEQGRPWVTLTEAHFAPLQKYLRQLPANNLRDWAEQVGVDADRLLQDWPSKFLTVFRLLLSADPGRRPHSVAELLAWLADPPPPPLAGLIALHTEADTAKLLLDCTGVEVDLEMTIQCARNTPPCQPEDGATVAAGPLLPVVGLHNLPLTTEPIFYTAFTRRRNGDGAVFSPGVSAQLWQPDGKNLRQWVEAEAAAAFDARHTPTRVGMVLGSLDAGLVGDSLIASTLPRVRAWACAGPSKRRGVRVGPRLRKRSCGASLPIPISSNARPRRLRCGTLIPPGPMTCFCAFSKPSKRRRSMPRSRSGISCGNCRFPSSGSTSSCNNSRRAGRPPAPFAESR